VITKFVYPSALKRLLRGICQPCTIGLHEKCPDPACPCLCNDEELKLPVVIKPKRKWSAVEMAMSA
jgi:hypothetical protein